MPRSARIVVPGLVHHVTQRGNLGAPIFDAPGDRVIYIDRLRRRLDQLQIEVIAWCLMTNHVHLAVIPRQRRALAALVGPVHSSYAQWLQRRRGYVGHLFQGRFYSCPVDDDVALDVVRYIELNPVRAGMVGRADEHPWSSARHRVRLERDALLTGPWTPPQEIRNWSRFLLEVPALGAYAFDRIRDATRTGKRLHRVEVP